MKLLKIATVVPLLFLYTCKKEVSFESNSGRVELTISNIVDGQSMAFNKQYHTNDGEDFILTKFKYYISNIALMDSARQLHKVANSYFLFDQSKPESLDVYFKEDIATYKGIQFLIGVDSIRNISGAQTDALDPLNEMFWTWNTGYIMAKMEGSSSLSNLPDNRIEYHIGGFQGPGKVLRTVYLPFEQNFRVDVNKTLSVLLTAEALSWFSAVHDMTIS